MIETNLAYQEKKNTINLQIQEAYDVLKDEDKKRKYDRYGESGVRQDGGGYSNPFSDGPFKNNPFFTSTNGSQHENDAAVVDAVNFIGFVLDLLKIFLFFAQLFGIFSSRRRR